MREVNLSNVYVEHSDFPWLVTIDVPFKSAQNKGKVWETALRLWLKEAEIKYYWEESQQRSVIFRVASETDIMLIKVKYS